MKQLTCEMCGSTELIKQDGYFVCQTCSCKYSIEEAKKMMVEGTVDVQGTVKVDNTAFVQKYLTNARRARQKEDWQETEKYYNLVEQNDPTKIEAILYSTFARVKSALLEAETKEKRQAVFNTLIKGVSVIDDNYDNANEEHQRILFEIMDDIKGLKEGKIVPTTHLQEYVTKNGYGNIVDRSQVIENDSLDITYEMIDNVIESYMDSLANIIMEHSPETAKKLFIENVINISAKSQVHEKVAAYIDGYKTPKNICSEIAKKVYISDQTTIESVYEQINEAAKTVCPFYMSDGKVEESLKRMIISELKQLYPDAKAFKMKFCYVATAVYGSYDCPQVWPLRRFRDNTLGTTWYGRLFIRIYYAVSPTLVKWFGDTNWFKKLWKGKLDRMVAKLRDKGIEDTPYEDKNWQ